MDMKRDYREDIRLFPSNVVKVWFFLLIAFLVLLPLFTKGYIVYNLNLVLINVIVALGMNILVGYTGQISLGHAGFFAIGAYASALIMTRLDLPFVFALPASGLIAAAFGFLLGLPALRLKGPYLVIATMGFGMAIIQIIGHWEGFFGGHMGIITPKISFGPFELNTDRQLYYVIMIVTVGMTIAAINIIKSRIGRAFIAIRDSDIAAETIGVNLTHYKTLAFAVSAFYTGIGGSLMGFVLGFINPQNFNFFLSIYFLAMVVVGGLGSILGSILGAIIITFLQIQLNNIPEVPLLGKGVIFLSERWFSMSGIANVSSIIFGLVLIVIIIFEPLGLWGRWLKIKYYWKKWPF